MGGHRGFNGGAGLGNNSDPFHTGIGGGGYSWSKPLGNLGSSNSVVGQVANNPYVKTGAEVAASFALPGSTAFMAPGALSPLIAGNNFQKAGGSAGSMARNPMTWLTHGLNTQGYLNNQHNLAKSQAQTAGLIGQQQGNALGGGGYATHLSNMGYDQALAHFAQMAAQQNQQAQGQAMGGIESLMMLLPLLMA